MLIHKLSVCALDIVSASVASVVAWMRC